MPRRNFLRAAQMEFDGSSFDQTEWTHPAWRDQKTAHIALHVGKAIGKIIKGDWATMTDEVCPDLAIYRTQLINLHGIPRGTVGPMTDPAQKHQWLRLTAHAQSLLCEYLEPLQHGQRPKLDRQWTIAKAATDLWRVHEGVADYFGLDPEQAHKNRLAQLSTLRSEEKAKK
jgi:hypothetical protein